MFWKLNKLFFITIVFLLGVGRADALVGQFDRNLYYGLKSDSDVVILQETLRKLGFFTYTVSTGNYFSATVDAVKRFQTANGIKPASGYFGPLTRAEINRLIISSSINTTSTTPTPTATPTPTIAIKKESATSTYWGKIAIKGISKSDKPDDEYLTIQNVSTTSERISITGFKMITSTGEEFKIPKGHNIPGISPVPNDNIVLARYETAKIITGRQENRMDFRENICEGYLTENSNFGNKLSRSCPKPAIATELRLPDHCIKVFESTASCRTADLSKIQIAECIAFSDAHLNYQGCVNDFRTRSDFLGKNWLIWMQRSRTFLRTIHDKITLYDNEGKIVHIFTF